MFYILTRRHTERSEVSQAKQICPAKTSSEYSTIFPSTMRKGKNFNTNDRSIRNSGEGVILSKTAVITKQICHSKQQHQNK